MPALLEAFPLPTEAAEALRAGLASVDSSATSASVPTVQDWLRSMIPTNPIAAAANDKVLALVVFTAVFAFAVTRIGAEERHAVGRFFKGDPGCDAGGRRLGAETGADRRAWPGVRGRRGRRRIGIRRRASLCGDGVDHRHCRHAIRLCRRGGVRPVAARRLLTGDDCDRRRSPSRPSRASPRCRRCSKHRLDFGYRNAMRTSPCRSRLHCSARPDRR